MKRALLVTAAFALISSFALAQDEGDKKEITGAEDLVKEKSRLWGEVWVRPDLDLGNYDKLFVWQTVFQFRDVSDTNQNRTTTAMLRGDQGPYTISEEGRTKFENLVTDIVVEELNRTKQFEVVDTIGPGTLIVRALVLDIVSNVPPNIGRQGHVHLSNMGEATVIFELIDAETGVIQARAGDRRAIQPPSRMNELNPVPANQATVWNDVEIWARDRAMTLRKQLDKQAKIARK